jgi:membrane dipeptidase
MDYPIVDLHCDLLSYLQINPARTPFDPASKTSHGQMKRGGIFLQTLAIFTLSKPKAFITGRQQLELLDQLLQRYPEYFTLFDPKQFLEKKEGNPIQLIPAFENAYALCDESQPVQEGLDFFELVRKKFKQILYISLTWDGENRFGGGMGSSVGLKEDGARVLDYLHEKKIAIDLSHTSDFLADDILNYVDKHALQVPIIASHSNMRSITDRPRNLPDLFAKEIIRRKGLIGLNLFGPFIGNDHKMILKHIEHAVKLGGEKSLCFGADFFPDQDFPYIQQKYNIKEGFFPELHDASCYPYLLSLCQKELGLSDAQLQGIAYQNFHSYLKEQSILESV